MFVFQRRTIRFELTTVSNLVGGDIHRLGTVEPETVGRGDQSDARHCDVSAQ